MKNLQLDRIEKVDIEVVKMRESSGNEQFFVRFSRNDCGDDFLVQPVSSFCLLSNAKK